MSENDLMNDCLKPAYFAEIPNDMEAWHTDTSMLAEYGPDHIVLFESPVSINGFPMITWSNARDVAACFQNIRQDALRCIAESETMNKMGYLVDPDKRFTFVFLHELPKLKRTFADGKVSLNEIVDIREALSFLETNFSTKYARCDLVRQTVDWKTFSATLND